MGSCQARRDDHPRLVRTLSQEALFTSHCGRPSGRGLPDMTGGSQALNPARLHNLTLGVETAPRIAAFTPPKRQGRARSVSIGTAAPIGLPPAGGYTRWNSTRSTSLSSATGCATLPHPIELVPPSPAVRDPGLLNAAATAWRTVLGSEPAPGVLLGVTDSSWLSLAGIPTLPALGCGSLAVAHQPNERIRETDVAKAIDLTEALARAYADYVASCSP
jgi:hypothetical protein